MPGPSVALRHAVIGTEISDRLRIERGIVYVDRRFIAALVARFVALGGYDGIIARHGRLENAVFDSHFLFFGVKNFHHGRTGKVARIGRLEGRHRHGAADQRDGRHVRGIHRCEHGRRRILDSNRLFHIRDGIVRCGERYGVITQLICHKGTADHDGGRTVGTGVAVVFDPYREIRCRAVAAYDFGARKVGAVSFAELCIRKRERSVDRESFIGFIRVSAACGQHCHTCDREKSGEYDGDEFSHVSLLKRFYFDQGVSRSAPR